jgi:hypothetical protein
MEKIQTEVAGMIENPSWQDKGSNLPIMSVGEFNLFLRTHLDNSDLSDAACHQMKKQLVNSGFLLDFRKLVVMKPQWLADTFKAIISTKNEDDKEGKDGILSLDQIVKRLGFDKELCMKLIDIWEKNLSACIIHPKYPDKYIIPSLLDEKRPTKLDTQWNEAKSKSECVGRRFLLPFLPSGIFEGIFAKSFGVSRAIEFWRDGLLLCKENESYLLLEIKTDEKSRINSSQYQITIHATGLIQLLISFVFFKKIQIF